MSSNPNVTAQQLGVLRAAQQRAGRVAGEPGSGDWLPIQQLVAKGLLTEGARGAGALRYFVLTDDGRAALRRAA